MGISIGTTLAAGVFVLVARLPEEDLLSWGWRIPFLASVVLIAVAVWIRLTMQESPAFEELREQEKTAASPMSELVANGRGMVLRGIGLRMGENGTSYLYSTFSFAYLVGVVGTSKSIGPLALAVASVCAVATLPFFGWLSDRYGRRRVYRYGALFQALYAFPAFALLNTGNTLVIVLTVTVAIAVGVDSMLGAQCAYLPELFGSRYRYLGVAASRELSAVIAGGIAPLVGAALLVAFDEAWWPVALYAALLATISFVATFFVPETARRDLVDERNAS